MDKHLKTFVASELCIEILSLLEVYQYGFLDVIACSVGRTLDDEQLVRFGINLLRFGA
jgi:hypothetical protein